MYKNTGLTVLMFLIVFSLNATTINVLNLNDTGSGSLRQAITDAVDGDIINITVSGQIDLSSELPFITKAITINGHSQGTTISGNNACRIFTVQIETGTITLNNLMIINGKATNGAAAALYAITGNNGKVVLNNCSIKGCVTNGGEAFGGAIATSADLDLINCTISENSAQLSGVIATLSNCTININNCTFYKNTGSSADGTGGLDISGGASANFQNSIIAGNTANGVAQNAQASFAGNITSSGNNLSNTTPCTSSGSDLWNKNLTTEIKLSDIDLVNNMFLCALNAGSLAVNAANSNSAEVDQRNYHRVGNADIGSFEYQPPVSTWNGTSWDNGKPWKYTSAVINGTYSGTGFECNNYTINEAKQFTLSSGTLTVNGDFTLKGGDTGNASFISGGTVSVLGNLAVESYLSANKWHLVSSALYGQTVASFLGANTSIPTKNSYYAMMDYNTASNVWNEYYPASGALGTMDAGKGYGLRVSSNGVITYSGSLLTGDKTVAVTNSGDNAWNLIGNPYVSAIGINSSATSADKFLEVNSSRLDPSYVCVYIWDDASSAYQIIGNLPAGFGSSRQLDQNYVPLGQGFFVKSKDGAASMNFTTGMQIHQPTLPVKSGQISWLGFELTVASINAKASTIVAFNEKMSKGLDPGYDAGLLRGASGLDVYTRLIEDNGVDFAIQCLPESGAEQFVIPLGIDSKEGGKVKFSTKNSGLPPNCGIYLEDRKENIITELKEGGLYEVALSSETKGIGRFYLHLNNVASGAGILNENTYKIQAYLKNDLICIQGKVPAHTTAVLYGVNGVQIGQYRLSDNELNYIPASHLAPGVYMLKLNDKAEIFSSKIVVIR